jgi:hypothetical protein
MSARAHRDERKRLPAYARELADARRRGMTLRDPTCSVALSGLRRPRIGFGVTVPDDVDPADLDWSWTRGLDVLVLRRIEPIERARAAVRAIRAAGAARLVMVDLSAPRIISIVDPEKHADPEA